MNGPLSEYQIWLWLFSSLKNTNQGKKWGIFFILQFFSAKLYLTLWLFEKSNVFYNSIFLPNYAWLFSSLRNQDYARPCIKMCFFPRKSKVHLGGTKMYFAL